MAMPRPRERDRSPLPRKRRFLTLLLGVQCAACASAAHVPPAPGPAAILELEARLAGDSTRAETLVALGTAYRMAARPAEAQPLLARAMALTSNEPGTVIQLAMTLEDLERYAEAYSLYEEYLRIGTSRALKARVRGRMAVLERKSLRAAIRESLAREAELASTRPDPSFVAVFPFLYEGANADLRPLSRALAELLATDLAQTDRIRVLERVQIQILLDELRLGESGLVDPATAARGGQLLGAGRIVQGRLDGTGERVRLQAAVIDVLDARMHDPVMEQDVLQRLFDMQKRLALSVYGSLGVELTAAERERINRRPTESLQALLEYGLGLLAEDSGNHALAARHFARAAREDRGFQAARSRAAEARQAAVGEAVTTTELGALVPAEIAQPLAGVDAVRVLVPSIGGRDPGPEVLGNEGVGRPLILEIILRRPR